MSEGHFAESEGLVHLKDAVGHLSEGQLYLNLKDSLQCLKDNKFFYIGLKDRVRLKDQFTLFVQSSHINLYGPFNWFKWNLNP